MELLDDPRPHLTIQAGCACMRSLVFAFLYLPIVVLIVYSFNGQASADSLRVTSRWTGIACSSTMTPIWDSVLNSLLVALAAMVHCAGLRNSCSTGARSRTIPRQSSLPPPRATSADFAGHHHWTFAPHALPSSCTKLSLLTIILGHGTALISVATTEVFAGLQKLDRAQEEASLDLGANYWQTFWRITVPNLRLQSSEPHS